MDSLEYSEEFHDIFHREYYGKKPVVIKNHPGRALINEQELLCIMRTHYESEMKDCRRTRFYHEHRILKRSEIESILPDATDRTVTTYLDRLKGFGKEEVCIALFSPFRYESNVFERTWQFALPFLVRLGIPALGTDGEIFIGNYAKTPFGVHMDPAGTLSLVVTGRKKMLVWPFEVFSERTNVDPGQAVILHNVDYRDYQESAVELVGEPGDILYWPASYWHIGVGDGTAVGTYNLSFYESGKSFDFIVGALRQAVDSNPAIGNIPSNQWSSKDLPETLEVTLSSLEAVVQEVGIRGIVRMHWARHLSSLAFTTAVQSPKRDLEHSSPYQRASSRQVLAFPVDDETLCLAYAGKSVLAVRHEGILELVKIINSGEAFTLKDFLEKHVLPSLETQDERSEAANYFIRLCEDLFDIELLAMARLDVKESMLVASNFI